MLGGEQVIALLKRYAPTWLVQMPALISDTELEAVQRRKQDKPTSEREHCANRWRRCLSSSWCWRKKMKVEKEKREALRPDKKIKRR
jgi:hypothetical protein